MDIGDRLKIARGSLTQQHISDAMKVSKNTYAMYERNERIPDASFLQKFCLEYKINPNWLLLGEEPIYRKERGHKAGRVEIKLLPEKKGIQILQHGEHDPLRHDIALFLLSEAPKIAPTKSGERISRDRVPFFNYLIEVLAATHEFLNDKMDDEDFDRVKDALKAWITEVSETKAWEAKQGCQEEKP